MHYPLNIRKMQKKQKHFHFKCIHHTKQSLRKKTEQNEIVFKSFVQLILCEIQHKKILEKLF